ncbi:MAG: hypothetical protein JXB60_06110 [Candidatus Cloacimonetes bacterium]|nr:hypothetical protein [Candidatus Cloacimonadota bacterium]
MTDQEVIRKILASKKRFPCRLDNIEGDICKEYFVLDTEHIQNQHHWKELQFRYHGRIDNEEYLLLEEYMFRDNETILDIKRAIGKNYYLSRE